MPVGENHLLRFGPYQLDRQCGQLRKNGFGLKLQGQPVQILEILLEKPGELVTREELRQRLWSSDTFVDFDHSLNTAIKRLRQALGDEAETPHYIETIPKRGYRFVGEVTHSDAKEQDVSAAPAVDETVEKIAATLAGAAISASEKSRSLQKWRILALSVLTLLVVAIAIYWATRPSPMPHIVGSHVLTKGHAKAIALVTDGRFVYFSELRDEVFHTLQVPVDGGEAFEVPNARGIVRDISPDGLQMLLLVPGSPRALWVMPLPNGIPRLIATMDTSAWAVWEASGRGVFFSRNNDTELYHVNIDATDARLVAKVQDISYLHSSPSRLRLRFAVAPSFELAEVNSDGSNFHRIFPGFGVNGGAWSPDEKYYFFSSGDGERFALWGAPDFRGWRRRNPPAPTKLTFGPMWVGPPIVSRDGRHLFASAGEQRGELAVYDPKSPQFVPYLGGISAVCVDFSRDAQWIAYVAAPEGTLWRSKIDGSERRQLTLPPIFVLNPRWSPDGKLIAFTDLSNGDRRRMGVDTPVRIYMISAEGGEPILLAKGGDPTWSPDGNSIAYGTGRAGTPAGPEVREIRILDVHTMNDTKVPGSDGLWSARWSPDGKYIVALDTAWNLMLFDFARGKWEMLAEGRFGWESWSRDSKSVYARDGWNLVRVWLSRKRETITNVGELKTMPSGVGPWFGITPDGRPITTLDKGVADIYAFDLEYK